MHNFPRYFYSSSTVLRHVLLGCPIRQPSWNIGFYCISQPVMQLSPFIHVESIHCHFCLLINTLPGIWGFLVTIVVTCHEQIPYNSTDRTLAQNSLSLMLMIRYLHFQILDTIAKPDLTMLMRQATVRLIHLSALMVVIICLKQQSISVCYDSLPYQQMWSLAGCYTIQNAGVFLPSFLSSSSFHPFPPYRNFPLVCNTRRFRRFIA